MIAPETVWLSFDTKIAPDVVIEPNVVFGLGVTVEEGADDPRLLPSHRRDDWKGCAGRTLLAL